jgi:site-specific recombinase XerD
MSSPNVATVLERVLAAAKERELAVPTMAAYRRAWLKLVAWTTAEGFDLGSLPRERALFYYEDLTGNRSASHHLQVKAGIAFLYKVLDKPNPFRDCLAPRFRPDAQEIHFLEAADLAMVLLALRELGTDYFGRLAAHLAEALFFTACRFHEWALLSTDRLVRSGAGDFTAARLRVKGGKYRDVPLVPRLSDSLREWAIFLEGLKGMRLRRGAVEFAGSELVFPGRDGTPISNQAFNRRLAAACQAAGVPVISAHGLRHSAANLLLNERGRNIRELQELLGHRSLATTARYTHIDRERLRGVVARTQKVCPVIAPRLPPDAKGRLLDRPLRGRHLHNEIRVQCPDRSMPRPTLRTQKVCPVIAPRLPQLDRPLRGHDVTDPAI